MHRMETVRGYSTRNKRNYKLCNPFLCTAADHITFFSYNFKSVHNKHVCNITILFCILLLTRLHKMGAAGTSETSLPVRQTVRNHVPTFTVTAVLTSNLTHAFNDSF